MTRPRSSGFSMGRRCEVPGSIASWASSGWDCLEEGAGVGELDCVVVGRYHECPPGDAGQVCGGQRRLAAEHGKSLLQDRGKVIRTVR